MNINHPSNWCGDKCLVCGGKADVYRTDDCNYKFVECESCGRFNINTYSISEANKFDKDKLASYLYYNGKINQPIKTTSGYFYNFIGNEEKFKKEHKENPYCYYVTKDIVENWFPKTFSEKVDMFLQGLSYRVKFLGDKITLTLEQLYSACFVIRDKNDEITRSQLCYFTNYLHSEGFIETNFKTVTILPNGLKRIDELQKNTIQNNKYAFVAMSFDDDMKEIRGAIKDAITEAGYIPRIMDEIQHNNQIVPEMLYEIRQAKFVIAELTNHNNGAYFEAGYAHGLGKKVIHVCKKDSFGKDGHFDVKQVNTILWESIDGLKTALINRIKATI